METQTRVEQTTNAYEPGNSYLEGPLAFVQSLFRYKKLFLALVLVLWIGLAMATTRFRPGMGPVKGVLRLGSYVMVSDLESNREPRPLVPFDRLARQLTDTYLTPFEDQELPDAHVTAVVAEPNIRTLTLTVQGGKPGDGEALLNKITGEFLADQRARFETIRAEFARRIGEKQTQLAEVQASFKALVAKTQSGLSDPRTNATLLVSQRWQSLSEIARLNREVNLLHDALDDNQLHESRATVFALKAPKVKPLHLIANLLAVLCVALVGATALVVLWDQWVQFWPQVVALHKRGNQAVST